MIFKHSMSATPFRQKLDDPDEGALLSDIGAGLSAISAIIVGAITWSFSLVLLSSGVDSINGGLTPSVLVFLAPILAVIFPSLVKLLFRSSTSAAIWLFAVAPLLGGLNIALDIFVVDSFGNGDEASSAAIQWLLMVVWLLPVFLAFHRAWRKRAS